MTCLQGHQTHSLNPFCQHSVQHRVALFLPRDIIWPFFRHSLHHAPPVSRPFACRWTLNSRFQRGFLPPFVLEKKLWW